MLVRGRAHRAHLYAAGAGGMPGRATARRHPLFQRARRLHELGHRLLRWSEHDLCLWRLADRLLQRLAQAQAFPAAQATATE